MMHRAAITAGALIIAAAAHVSIMATGGYQWTSAPLPLAVALGLVVGAICIGSAWRERRFAIAWCLIVALLAGEAFAVILTAERVVSGREALQAPVREAEEAHATARQRVARAEEALAAVPETSARLEAALGAKGAADAATIAKSAERNCLVNCRQLLQDQVDGAKAEVAAARSELADLKVAAEAELVAARAAIAGLKAPASASPLADRLGVASWALDLITAALASIAANGLGAALVAFGSHGARSQNPHRQEAPAKAKPTTPIVMPGSAREHAVRFGREMLAPASGTTPVVKLYAAYLEWCRVHDLQPVPAGEIGSALDDLFHRAEVGVETINGMPHVCGAKLRPTPVKRRALGAMVRT